jgi:dTDP-D-glucose 4,6-dehydratase
LDVSHAEKLLGWYPLLGLDETIERTVAWYRRFHEDASSAVASTHDDLRSYEALAQGAGAAWA